LTGTHGGNFRIPTIDEEFDEWSNRRLDSHFNPEKGNSEDHYVNDLLKNWAETGEVSDYLTDGGDTIRFYEEDARTAQEFPSMDISVENLPVFLNDVERSLTSHQKDFVHRSNRVLTEFDASDADAIIWAWCYSSQSIFIAGMSLFGAGKFSNNHFLVIMEPGHHDQPAPVLIKNGTEQSAGMITKNLEQENKPFVYKEIKIGKSDKHGQVTRQSKQADASKAIVQKLKGKKKHND
jgi:hypothetical protein